MTIGRRSRRRGSQSTVLASRATPRPTSTARRRVGRQQEGRQFPLHSMCRSNVRRTCVHTAPVTVLWTGPFAWIGRPPESARRSWPDSNSSLEMSLRRLADDRPGLTPVNHGPTWVKPATRVSPRSYRFTPTGRERREQGHSGGNPNPCRCLDFQIGSPYTGPVFKLSVRHGPPRGRIAAGRRRLPEQLRAASTGPHSPNRAWAKPTR